MKFNEHEDIMPAPPSEEPSFDSSETNSKLDDLLNALEEIDASIDYLTATISGQPVADLHRRQKFHGRAIRMPQKISAIKTDVVDEGKKIKITKSQLEQIIKEELQGVHEVADREARAMATIETAAAAMREAADELEWAHNKTHDKYSGYEPPSPEIVQTLRQSADQLETILGGEEIENY